MLGYMWNVYSHYMMLHAAYQWILCLMYSATINNVHDSHLKRKGEKEGEGKKSGYRDRQIERQGKRNPWACLRQCWLCESFRFSGFVGLLFTICFKANHLWNTPQLLYPINILFIYSCVYVYPSRYIAISVCVSFLLSKEFVSCIFYIWSCTLFCSRMTLKW